MSITRRTYQGGSVVTFIIVGVILAAGLIGTVYFLKQHGDQVRKDQAIAASDKQKKATEEAVKSEDANKSTTTGSSSSTTTSTSSEETSTTATGTSQDLPTTGSNLAIGELVGVFLLATTMTSYVVSRRNLA
jgi:cytoskeletal protein RodZ